MLSAKDKNDIYALLTKNFPTGKDIPLASVSLLLSKEIDYKKKGYPKRKARLDDLPYVERKREEGTPNVMLVLHPRIKKEKRTAKKLIVSKDLYQAKLLLKKQFGKGGCYPLSKVSKYLADNGRDFRSLGFSKRKSLLLSRKDILTLDEKDTKNVFVIFKGKEKPTKEKRIIEKKKSPSFSGRERKKAAKSPLVSHRIPDGDFYIPKNLILSIKEFSSLCLEDDSLKEKIHQDYREDAKAGKVVYDQGKDAFLFPLSFLTKSGDPVIGSVKKSAPGRDYPYYLNFIGSNKVKPKDYLFSMVHFQDFEASIRELASRAKKESWCYRHSKDPYIILKIYLQYTFYRIVSQKRLSLDDASSFGCFNTGLKNEEYEDIYGVVRKSKDTEIKEKLIFQGFCVAASQGLGKIVVEHFSPLPLPASYLSSPEELVYDTDKELLTDYHHIIQDNIDRFPLSWLSCYCAAFPEEKGILDRIQREKNEFRKSTLYDRLEIGIERNPTLYSLLKTALENTISKSIRMVKNDYRLAAPSFFPTRDVRSIRLPLEFGADKEVKAVLLVEKMPSGNYQGQTILTLKMAYVNARLIGPLEHTYLDPNQIDD